MTVHWTEAALEDLQAVEAYLARRSPLYARGMVGRLIDRADLLAAQPLIGPKVQNYRTSEIRELFVNPYRLLYRVADERVEVIAVVHAARRLPRKRGGA